MTSEQTLVGSLLMDGDIIEHLAGRIYPQMFTDQICKLIYEDFLNGYRQGKTVNQLTIQENHKDKKNIIPEIKNILENTLTSVGWEEAAGLLINEYKARCLNQLLHQDGINGTNVNERLAKIQVRIDELQKEKSHKVQSLADIARKYKGEYFKEHEMIHLGWEKLDECLGKLDRGDVTVIGARPAVGKSAFSAQIGLQLWMQNLRVGFFALEMADSQIYERYLSFTSGIEMKRIRRGIKFLGDEEKKYNSGNKDLEKFENLFIITDANTVDDIRSISKAMKFDVVIIDYMQLVKPADRYKGNRAGEVAEISGDLKRMAKELNCHVILLSQLNRKTEEQNEPTMAELRESGAIEQDASNILLLWTLSKGDKDGETKEQREDQKGVRVCKCRQGELGGAVFRFDGSKMFFTETDLDLDTVAGFKQVNKPVKKVTRPGKDE